MGDKYRLTGTGLRRRDADGNPVVFETGDVIEPTDAELEAFGDLMVPVDGDTPASTGSADAPNGPSPVGEYELIHGTYRTTEDGTPVIYEEGDVVELRDEVYEAFDDKFRPLSGGATEETSADDAAEVVVEDADAEGADSESETGDAEDSEDGEESDDADDQDTEDDVEDAGPLDVPEDFEHDLPEDFPATLPDDYQALRQLAPANGIDGNQSKADLVSALEDARDNGGD